VGTATTLAGYRAKYRLYRSDADLRAAHAAHAFLPVWDDHEFVNDYDRLTIVEQPDRAAAAYRAWFEYQPVWPIDGTRIHRRARFGSLVDLALLDTRQYRDPPPQRRQGHHRRRVQHTRLTRVPKPIEHIRADCPASAAHRH